MNRYSQLNLSKKIIRHLVLQDSKDDDLTAIVLGICDGEIKKLSDSIDKTLSELIKNEDVIQYKDLKSGKIRFSLNPKLKRKDLNHIS